MIFTGVNQMQHGKDFHSTFVERSQRVVWLNEDDMYSRQGFFVTKLLLLLCAGFVMPLERIERNKSLTGLFGKKLNRALRQNGQKYFQEFVENEEWNFYKCPGIDLKDHNIDELMKKVSENDFQKQPRNVIEYNQLFRVIRNSLAHGQAYPLSTSQSFSFPSDIKPTIQHPRESTVIDRTFFVSELNCDEESKRGCNLLVCSNAALFDFWKGWKTLITKGQGFKEQVTEQKPIGDGFLQTPEPILKNQTPNS